METIFIFQKTEDQNKYIGPRWAFYMLINAFAEVAFER